MRDASGAIPLIDLTEKCEGEKITLTDRKYTAHSLWDKMISNKQLNNSVIATTVLTLIAHGYSFTNATFANDRIAYFSNPYYGTENSGKWFAQYYSWIKAYSYVPWLIGVLSILFLTVSVYVTSKVLRVKRRLTVWLIAGLYTTNVSVITANLYGMDDFMFALMMSALSVWFWYLKDDEKSDSTSVFQSSLILRIIAGAVSLSFCIGEYGSYASVGPCLAVLGCMVMLMQGEKTGYVFRRLLEYVVTFGVGLVVYYGILRVFLQVRGTQMTSYMGESRLVEGASSIEILQYVKLAFVNTLNNWRGQYEGNSSFQSMPLWMALSTLCVGIVLLVMLIISCRKLFREKKRVMVLALLLICFPFSAGLIYVMAFGNVHYLMIFSFVYLYIAIAKLSEECLDEERVINLNSCSMPFQRIWRIISTVSVLLLICFIFRGILAANVTYSGMEKKYVVSQSIATRMIDRIENTEGYTGTEDVVLVGHIMDGDYFVDNTGVYYWKELVAGLGVAPESTSFSHPGITPLFLTNVMGFSRPVSVYRDGDFSEEEKLEIFAMNSFPLDGSTKKINNTVVVKLSDTPL